MALKRTGFQKDVKLIANSTNEQCVAALQVSAGQPGSSSQNSAAQPAETFDLALFIHYLPTRALAHGSAALVCRNWLQAHREHAWRFMVLTAGNAEDLHDGLDMSAAHATVKSFLSAPREVRERAALSAESLTLKIAQLEEFLDHYEKWMYLPFDRLARLVIEGPTHAEHCRGLPLHGVDGLRLGFVLSKLSHTVETFILRVTLSDENDDYSHATMAAIVSTFSKLKVLDMPEARSGLGLFPAPEVSGFLECCQGLGVDINDFHESWLAHVPRLKHLHLNIHDMTSRLSTWVGDRTVYDCAPFFSFLAEKCPHLDYLHIDFGDYALVHCEAFTCISTSMKWLVLSFEDVAVEGLVVDPFERSKDAQERREAEAYEAECICNHLRPWVPHSCKLCVLKGLWIIDVEDSIGFIMNPEHAACA